MNYDNDAKELILKTIAKFNKIISDEPELKEQIIDTIENYINDSLWPSNFRGLEKALDRLKDGLARILGLFLINEQDIFIPLYGQFPETIVEFMEELQKRYSYKYSITAYRSTLQNDRYLWRTVAVAKFQKNGIIHCGISIVRNDGEDIYFEGNEGSIDHLFATIKSVMKAEG